MQAVEWVQAVVKNGFKYIVQDTAEREEISLDASEVHGKCGLGATTGINTDFIIEASHGKILWKINLSYLSKSA